MKRGKIIGVIVVIIIIVSISRVYTFMSIKEEYPKTQDLIGADKDLENKENIYVVLSHSGTIMSKLISLSDCVDKYSHASISLTSDLDAMYTFARYKWFDPFYGGFKVECLDTDVFARHKEAELKVLEVPVSKEQKEALIGELTDMYNNRDKWNYEYLGVLCANFDIYYRNENNYYCSDFVKTVLEQSNIVCKDELPKVTKPEDFLSLKDAKVIYEGYVKDYSI